MARRPAAAQTAYGPMLILAVEQFVPRAQRIVVDPFALRMLPRWMWLTAQAGRWRWLRELGETGSDREALGVWGGLQCRKRYVRDQARRALAEGIGQLVVLGAGLDTVAYQLAMPAGVPAWEVDMPENIAVKRDRVRAVFSGIPAGVHLVPVRFESDDLEKSLSAAGFRADVPTMFVWEAVTQYLTEQDVRRTLAFLAKAVTGSRLIFTFVRKDFLDGTNMYGAESLYRRFAHNHLWKFALDPSDIDPLLREYGWAEREQVGAAEYTERYLRPAGREDLTVSDIEHFVYAEKL
ncbi:MAG TPA: SAM-dependent methyltransferase [Pseudonocardiaceae bacterium]